MARAQIRRQVVGLAAVALVVLAGLALSPEVVFRQVERATANPFLAAGFFCVVYLVRPLFAWPTSAVAVAVGYVYGPVAGFPLALAGTVASACLPFAAARYFRIDAGPFGRLGASGERFFDATGDLRGMVASRLAPAPSDPVSAAAGLSGVPWRAFVLGTALGEVPWTAAAVLAGGSLDVLSVGRLSKNWWLVVAAAVAALLLVAKPAREALRRA
ncbi:TVP38/TMEM64 family protein [Haladaptatus salinisoli]|uniref:TVP38/TMEM64 family protein n=1 Tax=Haladaptatus salinisoli TaxID=2884876 RepID=UPI001D09FF52|nr:VTT domain-containing protein [Haladaptatus salinisoli]